MTVATGNFAELLWPGIRTTFGSDYGDYKPVYSRVFNVVRSSQTFEKDQGVTGLPLAGVKEQGAPAPYVDPIQGYQKEYVHVTYGLGSSVTREMWEDDQYRYINRIPRMLARSMRQTEETTHANVLNNAFTTETGADGIAVIAATHPNAATATTQSNQPSTAPDPDFYGAGNHRHHGMDGRSGSEDLRAASAARGAAPVALHRSEDPDDLG